LHKLERVLQERVLEEGRLWLVKTYISLHVSYVFTAAFVLGSTTFSYRSLVLLGIFGVTVGPVQRSCKRLQTSSLMHDQLAQHLSDRRSTSLHVFPSERTFLTSAGALQASQQFSEEIARTLCTHTLPLKILRGQMQCHGRLR
jgi:hypothetical protein